MSTKSNLLLLIFTASLFAGTVKQQYVFTTPEVVDNTVLLSGCQPYYADFIPSIPTKPVRILLPDGETALSFNVSYTNPDTLDGFHSLKPHRPEYRLNRRPAVDFLTRRSAHYRQNRLFPASVKQEGFAVHYVGGHPVFFAKVNPVQYNPVTGMVRYYRSLTVSVETQPAMLGKQTVKTTSEIKRDITLLVDNPAAAVSLAQTPVRDSDYEYLVITTNALQNGFDSFTAFNTRRGLRTRVVSIGDPAVTNSAGIDIQEKMRSFIKTQYAENNIQYVLIAGDAEAASQSRIPARGLFCEANDFNYTGLVEDYSADSIPADMYFGWLGDGTGNHEWKGQNAWGTYGTEDLFPEVAVGRFPVDNLAELNTMIQKTITYSEKPVESLCTRALFFGEFLWERPGGTPCYGDDEMYQLLDSCNVSYGATGTTWKPGDPFTRGFPKNKWLYTVLGEKTGRILFTTFAAAMRQYKAAVINHDGHSKATYLYKADVSQMTTSMFPQACTPETGNYFVALSGGCYPGAFDNDYLGKTGNDCVAEHLTKTLSTGAVAAIFNARYGFGSDGTNGVAVTDGSEQKLRRFFWHGVFGKGIHNLGKALDYSKWSNAGDWAAANGWTNQVITGAKAGYPSYWGQLKWTAYGKNLIGDPALSMWTNAPRPLSVQLPSPLTTTAFTVTVPRNSTVALADAGGNIFISQATGDDTTCVINNSVLTAWLAANPSAIMTVIIKAHNCYPYSGTVQVNMSGQRVNGLFENNALFSASLKRQVLTYSLPQAAGVTLQLFNARGAIVRSNTSNNPAGRHQVSFANSGLSTGTYFCRLTAGRTVWNGTLCIMK